MKKQMVVGWIGLGLMVGCASGGADPAGADDDVTGACVKGDLYCGGHKVDGDPGSLYQCEGSGRKGRIFQKCATRCDRNPGRDDSCSEAPTCVTGGTYCGGDKVN